MSSYKHLLFSYFLHPFLCNGLIIYNSGTFLDCIEVLVTVLRLDVRNVSLFIVAYCCCLLLLFIVVVYCLFHVNTHKKPRTFCLIVRLCLSYSHQFQDQNKTSVVNAAAPLILGGKGPKNFRPK